MMSAFRCTGVQHRHPRIVCEKRMGRKRERVKERALWDPDAVIYAKLLFITAGPSTKLCAGEGRRIVEDMCYDTKSH